MLKIEDNHVTIINSICAILEVCKQYLEFKRTASINQRTRFFLQFKVAIPTQLRNTSIAVNTFPCSRSSSYWTCWSICSLKC